MVCIHHILDARTPEVRKRVRFGCSSEVFCNVLEAEGDTSLELFTGRGAGVSVDGKMKGLGWRHYHSCKAGFGGEETSMFRGKGRYRGNEHIQWVAIRVAFDPETCKVFFWSEKASAEHMSQRVFAESATCCVNKRLPQ